MKVLTICYRRLVVVVRPLDEPLGPHEPPPGVEIRLLCPDDIEAYLRLRPDQGPARVRGRLARGDRCFAVWRGGEIAHAGWVAMRRAYVPYLDREMHLEPGDIHPYDHYTRADARRLGCARLRMAVSLAAFRDEGYRRSVGLVAWENAAGLSIARAAGYRALGRVSCLRLGPWRLDREEAWGHEPLPRFAAPSEPEELW